MYTVPEDQRSVILLDHFLPSISFTSRACNYCLWQFFTVFTLLLSSHDAYLLTYLDSVHTTYPKEDKKVMEFLGEKRKNVSWCGKKWHLVSRIHNSKTNKQFFGFLPFFAKNSFSKNSSFLRI